jgi:DNA repair exonuclease SbcCD nuclease subunit
MNKITFFHCGDIHFDVPFTTLSSKLGLPKKRRQDIMEAFSKLIDLVKKEQPDFLFIAGDLYEQEYSNLKTVNWINEKFCEIEDTKVILIAGNHDTETKNSFYKTLNWNDNVYFIGKDKEKITFDEYNLDIYGIGFSLVQGQKMKLNDIECETNKNNVLLFHGDVDIDIGNRDYNALTSVALESKGFDYIGVSHNHKYRNDFGSRKIIYNAGSLEALGFDEEGEHGFIKGSITNKKLTTQFISLGYSKYKNIEIDIEDIETDVELIKQLKEILTNKQGLYRVVLKGKKDIDTIIDIKKIEKILKEEVEFIRFKDKTQIKANNNIENMQGGLKKAFISKITKQMEEENEANIAILKQALIYGLQAIEDENIDITIGDEQ